MMENINRTAITSYLLTNDAQGRIVLTPAGKIDNKPARSRVLMDEIERLEAALQHKSAVFDIAFSALQTILELAGHDINHISEITVPIDNALLYIRRAQEAHAKSGSVLPESDCQQSFEHCEIHVR